MKPVRHKRSDASSLVVDSFGVVKTWELAAACMLPGAPPLDEFFPQRERGRSNSGSVAKATCRGCPVLAECLVDSLDRHEKFGIRAGAGESERRVLQRRFDRRPHHDPAYDPQCSCASCETITGHLVAVAAGRPSRHDSNGPGAMHGNPTTYNRGCRCGPCVAGRAMYDDEVAARRRDRVPVVTVMPTAAAATFEDLEALLAAVCA